MKSEVFLNRTKLNTESLLQISTVLMIIAVVVFFSVSTSTFMTAVNISNILSNSTILMLVAVGLCFVIAAGGVDLSIAAAVDLGAMTSVLLLRAGTNWIICIFAGLIAGSLLGLFNSFMVIKAKIAPFIATLGSLFIVESIQQIITRGGEPIHLPGMNESFRFLGRGSLFMSDVALGRIDFRFSILLALIVASAAFFVLSKTSFGRRVKAIGAQKDAAELAGIPVKRYICIAFVVCSCIAALGGMVSAAVLTTYVPLSGRFFLMDAIGAVFIGTTFSKHGFVNVPGTIVGVVFFSIVNNGLNLLGIHMNWQNVTIGILIFLFLALDAYRRNMMEKPPKLKIMKKEVK